MSVENADENAQSAPLEIFKNLEGCRNPNLFRSPQSNIDINESSSMFIRLLHPEVIAEIFMHYAFLISEDYYLTAKISTPLLLGSVCSSWRKIAWSTPSLWCSLTLVFSSYDIFSSIKLEILEQWLSRTGILPLSLNLFAYDIYATEYQTEEGSARHLSEDDDAQVDGLDHESNCSYRNLDESYSDGENYNDPISESENTDDHNEEEDHDRSIGYEGSRTNSEEEDEKGDEEDEGENSDGSEVDGRPKDEDDEDDDGDGDGDDSDGDSDESDDDYDDESSKDSDYEGSDPDKYEDEDEVTLRTNLLELIDRYASRWHSIHFQLSQEWFHYFSHLPGGLPNLKSLRFNPNWTHGDVVLDLRHYPMLRHIDVIGPHSSSFRLNLQWDQIRSLDLTVCTIDMSLETLSYLPHLTSCSLVYPFQWLDQARQFESQNQILLPHLKRLSIDNDRDTDLQHFFEKISAPDLTEFFYEGGTMEKHLPICDFISRSPSLRTFSLNNTRIPSHDILIQLLRTLQGVVQFTFIASPESPLSFTLNDHILGLCTPNGVNDTKCLLPALEICSYTGPPTYTSMTMEQFIESRKSENLGDKQGCVSVLRSAIITVKQGEPLKPLNRSLQALLGIIPV